MFLSRIKLNLDNRAAVESLLADEGYLWHQRIWQLFADSPQRDRDFLYRREQHQDGLTFFSLSERAPRTDHAAWLVESKPFNPKLAAGNSLQFRMTANAVIRTRADDKARRHDVVMHYKHQLKQENNTNHSLLDQTELVQIAGEQWLTKQGTANGFDLTDVKADGYIGHTLRKNNSNKPVRFHTIDFAGKLTLTDPERFLQRLYQGFGSSKGFGCGLMLIRKL